MRLITETELSRRSDVELAVLFQMVAETLGRTQAGTHARRTAIASLQNICRARVSRHMRQRAAGL